MKTGMNFFRRTTKFHSSFLGKFLKLLAINQGSSKRREIFVPWLLKLTHVVFILQRVWVHTSPQSALAPFPGCQGFFDIVPNGSAGSFVSFNICQGLKCQHVASILTLIMRVLWANCTLSLTNK